MLVAKDATPSSRWQWLLGTLFVVLAVGHAASAVWLSDDAFISFRYARNLVEGNGLVFNPGERVEGYTNPLWTLAIAGAMAVGMNPELFSLGLSIAAYTATVVTLLVFHRWAQERSDRRVVLPVAALLAAADTDWATHATGGLETAFLTFLVSAAFVLALTRGGSMGGAAGAGLLAALAAMTRLDALLLGLCGALTLDPRAPQHRKRLATYGAMLLVPTGLFMLAKAAYYGSLLPNTYYAKSAALSWWSQGLVYVWLFLLRHGALVGGAVLALAVFLRDRPSRPLEEGLRRALIASLTAFTVYALYVAKVGGDFMFARFLIPVTPLAFIAFESLLLATKAMGPRAASALCAAVGLGLWLTPCPVGVDVEASHGIVDEARFYSPELVGHMDAAASHMAPFLVGTQARVAIYGSEARLAYRARMPIAIEANTGLTDAYVARLPLSKRGRIGHEKEAPYDYLVLERKAHFMMLSSARRRRGLDEYIPDVRAILDGVPIRLLHWDPAFAETLHARGAHVQNAPAMLDDLLTRAATLPATELSAAWSRWDHFYFRHVDDPRRREQFQALLRDAR